MMGDLQDMDELETPARSARSTAATSTTSTRTSSRRSSAKKPPRPSTSSRSSSRSLEDAGYIRRKGNNWELTPRGVKKLGEKALGEIYQQLKKSTLRQAPAAATRAAAASAPTTPSPTSSATRSTCNLGETIMNGIFREGPQVPVHLQQDDFPVYRAETLTHDGDRDDARPLVVDGAARQLPGREEGRARAATT